MSRVPHTHALHDVDAMPTVVRERDSFAIIRKVSHAVWSFARSVYTGLAFSAGESMQPITLMVHSHTLCCAGMGWDGLHALVT